MILSVQNSQEDSELRNAVISRVVVYYSESMHIKTSRGKMRIRRGPGDARCELPGVPSQWSTQLSQKCSVITANREVHLGLVTRVFVGGQSHRRGQSQPPGPAEFKWIQHGPLTPPPTTLFAHPNPSSAKTHLPLPLIALWVFALWELSCGLSSRQRDQNCLWGWSEWGVENRPVGHHGTPPVKNLG